MENSETEKKFEMVRASLFSKTKAQINELRLKTQRVVNDVNLNFIKTLYHDLYDKSIEKIHENEDRLNLAITEDLVQLKKEKSEEILELYKDLKLSIFDEINNNIVKNEEKYVEFLKSLITQVDFVNKNEYLISLNSRDQKLVPELMKLDDFSEFKFSDVVEDIFGGLILKSPKNKLTIELSIDGIFEQYEEKIKSLFMSVFPEFNYNIKSASDLIEETELLKVLKVPESIKEFILSNNLDENEVYKDD